MSIITLLTDFGLEDPYVGIMKGVILSINPSARIVDISHHVDPQDLTQAAFILESAIRFFPEDCVHLVVVDPGVGSGRDIVALRRLRRTIVAPDNGVLTRVIETEPVDRAVRVENSDYFLDKVSRTFHGRDIFAPVGAHVSRGVELDRLGAPVEPENLVRLDLPRTHVSANGELVGVVVHIDRFGNCVTNITEDRLKSFCRTGAAGRLRVAVGGQRIEGLARNYEAAGAGKPLAIVGSFGCLEIAVNRGSARSHFKLEKGDAVRVDVSG